MAATISPFFNINYGWETGDAGWGDPVNDNFKALSFLGKGAVDAFVGTLPGSPSEGDSVVYTVDNLFYVRIGGSWMFITPQSGMEINETSTGKRWQYTGSWVEIPSTVALKTDLANFSDITRGSGLVGWKRDSLVTPPTTVGRMLSTQAISPWEFTSLIVSKPNPSDSSTWDWTPAFQAMHAVVSAGPIKTIVLSGIYRFVGGLAPTTYEWAGVTFLSDNASIILDTPTGDNVGLQLGSNSAILGHLTGSVINGVSNGNGFVRLPICIGRWWDSVEVINVSADFLTLTGMTDGVALAIAGNTHGVKIGHLSMGAGQLGLMMHWTGLPNNLAPTSTYHPHDIHIGSVVGAGFTEAMITESACYDVRIDYINGQNNYRDLNHIGGDFGETYAIARDAGKVCKGNSVGRINSTGTIYRSVDYNASAGLVVNIMLGEFSIDSIRADGTGVAASVGVRLENRESGRIGFADVSGFVNNILQINCNGGDDGELRSSNATQQGIVYSAAKHIRADVLRTTNDNQGAGGGTPGVSINATSTDIDVGFIRVSTNNTATHGCVIASGGSNIRIRQVNGAVDASRALLVDNSAANVNRIGPCILDSGAISYSGPDSFVMDAARGTVIGWGSAIPTTGTFKRGDILMNTLATAAGKAGWICVSSGTPGTWKPFGVIDA